MTTSRRVAVILSGSLMRRLLGVSVAAAVAAPSNL